jgi:carbamoyl-phosphate synthase large subunit
MPKRTDISSILIIGSGPIVIGQACEFDYSGTQAMKALREEGYRVILINSNPATIMTDPEFADATYIEPITPEFVERIIAKERPDAILPTMGGQTALNTAIALEEAGILDRYNCELIGAKIPSIKTAEDRELFRRAMDEIGLNSAKSELVTSINDAENAAKKIGYPLILRPSRTLGGYGGGVVEHEGELHRKVQFALSASPNQEVLIEQSLTGWKEIELEVMRDLNDNVVIVCGIENLDPMGVHTGDSITVAPIQTLTDKEYQALREAAKKVMRRIGVDTGGSNVQFAMNPANGEIIVIEMNPRVSRSSALASKATGFPIAKIAAKLAVGYTLDEITNDITKETPACFEPSIDYVVVKIPRFNFEKFPLVSDELGTQMKSVGEVLSFGRTFREALQKAMCSMELGSYGFDYTSKVAALGKGETLELTKKPTPNRLWYVGEAFRKGCSVEEIFSVSKIDHWFLAEIEEIIEQEKSLKDRKLQSLSVLEVLALKQDGFSDARLAALLAVNENEVREYRQQKGVIPSYKSVDTCAAEFVANTPYLYSTYDGGGDAPPTDRKKVIVLGSGPNRIGQGIEFDYCCVHAVMALRELGFEAIMINCNPETVSTDYDISDRLYFEPLTFESVRAIIDREQPYGVIVQYGGQTPLKLAGPLEKAGVNILGTSVASIDATEDRKLFSALVERLGLKQPENATASSLDEAVAVSKKLGFPLMIRPSFVLGGRAMRVIFSEQELREYIAESVEVSNDRPVLLDRYLDNAIELDVDVVADGQQAIVAGVMEHIERVGVHSGDSSCCLPPPTLGSDVVEELKRQARLLAKELNVRGLMNVQFAVTTEGDVMLIEVNPRASRTVPFVSKAMGIPWAKIAAKVMAGSSLTELGAKEYSPADYYAVKASVFPFNRFPGSDTILGPEMKSTGEVMGIHSTFAGGFAKSQIASGVSLTAKDDASSLPKSVFLSVTDRDKQEMVPVMENLRALGMKLYATAGTAKRGSELGFEIETVNKVREGSPHVLDLLGAGKIDLVINTPEGTATHLDSRSIRLVANELKVPTYTTMAAALALTQALLTTKESGVLEVQSIQDYHRGGANQ